MTQFCIEEASLLRLEQLERRATEAAASEAAGEPETPRADPYTPLHHPSVAASHDRLRAAVGG